MYQTGLHIIASIEEVDAALLKTYEVFKLQLESIIAQHGLQKLGEVYHNFAPAGFTAVVCLSESHISVHTWPEHGLVNYDIYLSNHERVNDATVMEIDLAFQSFFKGKTRQSQQIKR